MSNNRPEPARVGMMLTRRAALFGGGVMLLPLPVVADGVTAAMRPLPRPGSPAARDRLRLSAPAAADLVAAAKLGGNVGFHVADAATGLGLESLSPGVPLPPASVTKVITAAFALDRLGADHRFATRILAIGPVSNGTLQGDLILAGGGDPTLDTDRLGDLAATLAARGLRRITGRYLVWGAALPQIASIDTSQDVHLGYNPAISGLNLNYNRVHFEWRRGGNGYDVTMEARGERFRPQVPSATVQIVDRTTPLFTYDAGTRVEGWTVAQRALGKGGSRWLPVRRPELYAGDTFRVLLRAHGVDLPAPEIVTDAPTGNPLAQTLSDPLREIVRGMLKFSTNLTAEVIGLASSGQDSIAASAAAMGEWARTTLGMTTARFGDHSGLGNITRVTASEMTAALVRLHAQGRLPPLLKRHEPGKKQKGGTTGAVVAKTGTLNFVSALAGYITLADGSALAFSILCADPERRDAIPLQDRESPPGGEAWTARARNLEHQLLSRWGLVYGS